MRAWNKPKAIKTKRFVLKPLRPSHATQKYLNWLRDEVVDRQITSAKRTRSVRDLQKYIREFSGLENCVFLRILHKKSKQHIGNIKYYPVDLRQKIAVMGILIGEPSWRGKGVAKEVLDHTAKYLRTKAGIRRIYLGAGVDNLAAIRAYRKAGFKCVRRWADGAKPRTGQKIMVREIA
jgi:ribosomal-protein-alanine N-acetyltransferase